MVIEVTCMQCYFQSIQEWGEFDIQKHWENSSNLDEIEKYRKKEKRLLVDSQWLLLLLLKWSAGNTVREPAEERPFVGLITVFIEDVLCPV